MIPSDLQLREFLLRRLPLDAAARLEEAILVEEGVAERLRLEEYDLIDDFVGGRLNEADSVAVKAHLLNTADAPYSLLAARALALSRRRRATTSSRWLRPMLGAGGLLAASLAAFYFFPRWDNPGRDGFAHPEFGTRSSGLPRSPVTLQIVMLLADRERGSLMTIHWRENPAGVRLQAEIGDTIPQARYSFRIADGEDRELFTATDLEPRTAGHYRFVDVIVPSEALGTGTRLISVRSTDASTAVPANYTWRVQAIVDP